MNKEACTTEEYSELATKEYNSILSNLKTLVFQCQQRALAAANKELVLLYLEIGKTIVEKQRNNGWNPKIIEKLARDLQFEFPKIKGFSKANVFRMKTFFLANEKVAQTIKKFDFLPSLRSPLI